MLQIDIAAAKQRLSELIDKAINGEEVAIAKDDRSLVKLVPLPSVEKNSPAKAGSPKEAMQESDRFDGPQAERVSEVPEKREPRPSLFGSAKGLVWIADDFDEPLEEFKDYM